MKAILKKSASRVLAIAAICGVWQVLTLGASFPSGQAMMAKCECVRGVASTGRATVGPSCPSAFGSQGGSTRISD